MIKLFDIKDGVLKVTPHCYSITWLKAIIDKYPEDYLSIFLYGFYMTSMNEEENPFFNAQEDERESMILDSIDLNVSLDCSLIKYMLEELTKMYETPTSRSFLGVKILMDKMSVSMIETEITYGRDGTAAGLSTLLKNFEAARKTYKGVYRELKEEQSSEARGGVTLAYDQR